MKELGNDPATGNTIWQLSPEETNLMRTVSGDTMRGFAAHFRRFADKMDKEAEKWDQENARPRRCTCDRSTHTIANDCPAHGIPAEDLACRRVPEEKLGP